MKTFNIATIAGDGFGKEVVPEGIRVLEAAGLRFDFRLHWRAFDWSCETYVQTGKMIPDDGLRQLRPFDAIFLGAVGHPSVPDHVSLWGLLIPIRRAFQQYVNLRPVRLFEGIESTLKSWKPGEIDFTIVRENNEGEYSNIGGRLYEGTEDEMAVQETVFTRRGVKSRAAFRFRIGSQTGQASDLSDQIQRHHSYHALLGRMLSCHGGGISGRSRGPISPRHSYRSLRPSSGLVRHRCRLPSLRRHTFRPWSCGSWLHWHRSFGKSQSGKGLSFHVLSRSTAPLPTSREKASPNPIGQIWSGAMMLRHLGIPNAADAVESAINATLAEAKVRTPDIGGNAATRELGETIANQASGTQ
jgi:tartrate dehydrogenase/decarboxylase/D-malate dehydrogenase